MILFEVIDDVQIAGNALGLVHDDAVFDVELDPGIDIVEEFLLGHGTVFGEGFGVDIDEAVRSYACRDQVVVEIFLEESGLTGAAGSMDEFYGRIVFHFGKPSKVLLSLNVHLKLPKRDSSI